MGDPRKFKNKYEPPKKLWDEQRIKEDKTLRYKYGLKNAREVWIAAALLKRVRREARRLLSLSEEERKRDASKILGRLNRLGILGSDATLDDVLSLTVEDVLERRLQTIVYRKGLARTMKQARQLIVHRFVKIGDRIVNVPSYLVSSSEEDLVSHAKPISLEPKVLAESQPGNTEESYDSPEGVKKSSEVA